MSIKTPIGVFDSGFGGLTILKEIVKKLPEYDYIYLGDNEKAVQYLDSAVQLDFFHYVGFHKHPLVITLRGREDFRRLQKIVADYREFNKVAFTKAFRGWQGEEGMMAVLK